MRKSMLRCKNLILGHTTGILIKMCQIAKLKCTILLTSVPHWPPEMKPFLRNLYIYKKRKYTI